MSVLSVGLFFAVHRSRRTHLGDSHLFTGIISHLFLEPNGVFEWAQGRWCPCAENKALWSLQSRSVFLENTSGRFRSSVIPFDAMTFRFTFYPGATFLDDLVAPTTACQAALYLSFFVCVDSSILPFHSLSHHGASDSCFHMWHHRDSGCPTTTRRSFPPRKSVTTRFPWLFSRFNGLKWACRLFFLKKWFLIKACMGANKTIWQVILFLPRFWWAANQRIYNPLLRRNGNQEIKL